MLIEMISSSTLKEHALNPLTNIDTRRRERANKQKQKSEMSAKRANRRETMICKCIFFVDKDFFPNDVRHVLLANKKTAN